MSMIENKYRAFLCHSHLDNREKRSDSQEASSLCWGDWLHDALKSFSIPADFIGQVNGRGEIIPEQIQPIFHDDQELPDETNLSAEVRAALEQSRCLVVICSPCSARSLYVNEVVRHFKQLGRVKHIFPIVIAGEPNASEGNSPDATAADECFVPALRHPVLADGTIDTTRPAARFVFVDARHGVEKREILAKDHRSAEADLEMARIQLTALLLGVGYNGLWQREQKRHFFEFSEARQQTREALKKVEEARRQLEEAQRQTREAQDKALELQNLPREVHGQIQEAQNQAREAQDRAQEAQKQLQEFQNKVRHTQSQLEEARSRASAAESKVLEAQNQAREIQSQLETARNQLRESQGAQSQLEETRHQVQSAHQQFSESQSQVQELQNQARSAQAQLEEARAELREAQRQALQAQNQVREAQSQAEAQQRRALDAQGQTQETRNQIEAIQNKSRNARRLARVYALLAALGLLAAGIAAGIAVRQHTIADQALAKAVSAEAGKFDPVQGAPDQEQLRRLLEKIGGAEQDANRRRSLEQLADAIPQGEILEALKASSLIASDPQRCHFQKRLLGRLASVNPASAMACASVIEGRIVNNEGLSDSRIHFQLAVLEHWMTADFPAAFQWICQLPEADSRQRALGKIVSWVQSQTDAEARTRTMENCIAELAKTDVSRALAVAESLPAGEWRDTVIAGLVNRLVQEILQPRKAAPPWADLLLKPTSEIER